MRHKIGALIAIAIFDPEALMPAITATNAAAAALAGTMACFTFWYLMPQRDYEARRSLLKEKVQRGGCGARKKEDAATLKRLSFVAEHENDDRLIYSYQDLVKPQIFTTTCKMFVKSSRYHKSKTKYIFKH